MDLTTIDFSVNTLLFLMVALCVGMSKTGVHGAGNIAVPLLAIVFGGKLSSGVMLPLLCMADILGVWYYHRHADWSYVRKLMVWAVPGIVLGFYVGLVFNTDVFKYVMVGIIFVSVAIMVWLERGHREDIPDYRWFAALCGVGAGFTSMIGNLAGAFAAIYLLSMRLPKNSFIGTSAWFFLLINWIKVPFHIWGWKTITWDILMYDLFAIPLIVLGAWIGIIIVKNLSEGGYRWFIIGMTIVAAVFMLFT